MRVIEFTGSPKSGKSALINRLYEALSENLLVKIINNGFRNCPFRDDDNAVYHQQLWSTFSIANSLLESFHEIQKPDIMLIDRGFWDRSIWIEYLYGEGELSKNEYNFLIETVGGLLPTIDLVFNIIIPGSESVNRQSVYGRKSRQNPDTLDKWNEMSKKIVINENGVLLDGRRSKDDLQREMYNKILTLK